MYEHKKQPLAPIGTFYQRILKNVIIALLVMIICLAIGVTGFHFTDNVPWLDALHNASMVLSGMGPVVAMKTAGGKWFSSIYALFSGVVFITNIGIILAPAVHRFFHQLNLEK
ncbi:MAG: hypothetical protein ABUT20_48565 [Bacteroidota bacterium]